MITLSVISRSRYCGARPLARSASSTTARQLSCCSCCTERLTERRSIMPSRCHATSCRQASRSTRAPSAWIIPDSSAMGMNSVGGITPRTGSRQRSSASTAPVRPGLQVDLRLIGEEELVLQQSAPHVGLELQPRLHARIHVGRVEPVRVAADFLGRVHRGVRLLDERHGVVGVEREHRNADRARQRRRLVGEPERRQERFADARQHRHRLERRVRRIEPGQDHDELVAAEPRDRVGFAHRGREALRHRLQQLVARVVAERVVDALEVIEIEEQAGDVRAVALRLREDLLQPLVEQRPVRQPGEDVVLRELVGVRRRDLELVRALRDLLLERALVVLHLGLRFGEPLRHVVERVGERARARRTSARERTRRACRRLPRAPRASADASARRGRASAGTSRRS